MSTIYNEIMRIPVCGPYVVDDQPAYDGELVKIVPYYSSQVLSLYIDTERGAMFFYVKIKTFVNKLKELGIDPGQVLGRRAIIHGPPYHEWLELSKEQRDPCWEHCEGISPKHSANNVKVTPNGVPCIWTKDKPEKEPAGIRPFDGYLVKVTQRLFSQDLSVSIQGGRERCIAWLDREIFYNTLDKLKIKPRSMLGSRVIVHGPRHHEWLEFP